MKLLADGRGATAIEYAMIAAFLSVAIVTAVDQLGQNVKNTFFDQVAQGLGSP